MVTLAAWVQGWIDRRSIRLAPSTVSGYRGSLRKYITPSDVGSMSIDELTPADLIMLLSPVLATGHTRAAQLVQVLTGAALRDAVRQHIIPWSPMDCVDRIPHHKQHTGWLTSEQACTLIDGTQGMKYHIAWLLALCCGLRRGELLGLMWTDIDLDNKALHVRRQRVRVDGRILETPPKTESSIRDIPLADDVAVRIRAHRHDGKYVVGGTDRTMAKQLQRDLQRCGLPRVTIHGLRHTMAATAASEGVPIKVLQGIMGHAQYSTTADIYAHVDRAATVQAAKIVAIATLQRSRGARLEIV